MIKEKQIRVLPQVAADIDNLKTYISEEEAIRLNDIKHVRIIRRSIDARHRTVYVNLTVRIYINEQPDEEPFERIEYRDVSNCKPAIVVGAGPAGLFAALRLIELGIKPIVVERGKNVRERKNDIAKIARQQKVDTESNYSFGEGGAGAYSDGKLFTRSKKRGSVEKILRVFCQHGASTDILIDAHPHIGTDRLPAVIENMRKTIIGCGGEVYFQTKMTLLKCIGNSIEGIVVEELTSGDERELEGSVILATGHSARDVYRYLHHNNITMEAKGIAVGVRLEHPAHLIDQIQYHSHAGRGKYLPAAEYSFVTQVDGRGVYSFCMCPGGVVIPAATGNEQVVVNGMSPSNRNTAWSNSGMVVELRPEDLEGEDILRVMKYQEDLEKKCWMQANMKQTAPAQRMADFVNNKLSYDLPKSSYQPGLISSPMHFWMPETISGRLQRAFRQFGKQSHGFLTNDAVIIGVETRTSAPLRIIRNKDTLQHVEINGLYPCGEGAGYAGGIVSAAIDGERCAEKLAENMQAI